MPKDEKSPSLVPTRRGRIKSNYLVTQANDLINATMNLSLHAKKFLSCIISRIRPDDEMFCQYWVSVDEYLQLCGISSKTNYMEVLLRVASELRSVNIISRNEHLTKINGIIGAAYEDSLKKMIGAELNEDLKPFLIQLKRDFTSYQLQNIMRLKSTYSIKLYEILRQHARKQATVFRIEILQLRTQLVGDDSKYTKFNNFKQRVLDVAEKELNEKTDIKFSFKPLRQGRSYTYVEFRITITDRVFVIDETGEEFLITDKSKIPQNVLNLIPKTLLEDAKLIEMIYMYFESRGAKYVEKQLAYTVSKKPTNFFKYLKGALDADWGKNFDPYQKDLFSKPNTAMPNKTIDLRNVYEQYKKRLVELYMHNRRDADQEKDDLAIEKIKASLPTDSAINLRFEIEDYYTAQAKVVDYETWASIREKE